MNEFSHLLESQNSVTITDLLLSFSQFPLFLQSDSCFLVLARHSGFFCNLHFKRWLLKEGVAPMLFAAALGVASCSQEWGLKKLEFSIFQIENIFK